MALILASASLRRAELLASAGFAFTVQAAEIDETPLPDEKPDVYVRRVARNKARAVADTRTSGDIVLAADTTVVAEGRMFAKPSGPEEAGRMLRALSGVTHEVLTGIVVIRDDREEEELVRSQVRLAPLSPDEIVWYLNSGEPEGKAGAYAIQGRAARFVDWIEGSWSNVVGLPVATVYQMLKRVGA